MGFIDTVYPDGSPVAKSDVRSFGKSRQVLVLADADEVAASDLAGQLILLLKSTGRIYKLKTGDTTTEADGVNFLRDVNDLGFEIVLVQGFDGATVFVQDAEPATTGALGSLWVAQAPASIELSP